MKEIEITDELSASVWQSMNKAIDSKDPSTVYEYIRFSRNILHDSIIYNKLKFFREFISFSHKMYYRIAYKHRTNIGYQVLVHEISGEISLHLTEIINFYIGFIGKSSLKKIDLTDFYYEAFNSFNRLLYLQITYKDWGLFKNSLKRYRRLRQEVFSHAVQDEIRLREMEENNLDGSNITEIKEIRNEIQGSANFDKYKRQPLAAIKYWLLLLFEEDLIEEAILSDLLIAISNVEGYDPNKEVEDILFFRTADLRTYMGWEDWDHTDRQEVEVYYPPMPINWMTHGFVVDRLRNGNAYFNTSQIGNELMESLPFFYEAVKASIEVVRKKFYKWKRIIKMDNLDDFELHASNLLDSIALAKRSIIGDSEREISTLPLDQNSISEFKEKMGIAWKEQTRIRRIFSHFGNVTDVTDKDILLKRIGQKIFFAKGKIMFINGEHRSPIYGMEQLGSNIGRWEDDLFMEVIEQANAVLVQGKSMLETLDLCISKLRNQGTEPTMVFLEPQYIYKDDTFLNSELYSKLYNPELNQGQIAFFVLGTFDGIPLFSSYSPRLRNKIVVSDFSSSFHMLHKTADEWYDRQLFVDVLTVSEELVNDKYAKEPDKWRITDDGILLSEQDAKTLIRNSIVIDIETIADFCIKDNSKFVIGEISEAPAD